MNRAESRDSARSLPFVCHGLAIALEQTADRLSPRATPDETLHDHLQVLFTDDWLRSLVGGAESEDPGERDLALAAFVLWESQTVLVACGIEIDELVLPGGMDVEPDAVNRYASWMDGERDGVPAPGMVRHAAMRIAEATLYSNP